MFHFNDSIHVAFIAVTCVMIIAWLMDDIVLLRSLHAFSKQNYEDAEVLDKTRRSTISKKGKRIVPPVSSVTRSPGSSPVSECPDRLTPATHSALPMQQTTKTRQLGQGSPDRIMPATHSSLPAEPSSEIELNLYKICTQ